MIICYHNFNFQLEIYLLSDIVRSLGLDGPSESIKSKHLRRWR